MATSGFIMDALIRQSKIFTWILGRWEEEMMYFQQEFLPFISMSNVGVTNLKKTKKTMMTKINNTHKHFDFTGTYLTSDQHLLVLVMAFMIKNKYT